MVDETQQCIREGMISLLNEKEYSDIRMKEIAERAHVGRRTLYRYFDNKEQVLKYIAESLMDRFAKEIGKSDELTLQNVTQSLFVFVEKNRTEFLTLKKAGLLSYLEEIFPQLMMRVTAQTKHKGMSLQEITHMMQNLSDEDKYAYIYTWAGFWWVAMSWATQEVRPSPEKMTEIVTKITGRDQ